MNHHESKPQREQQVTSLAGTFARTAEEVFVGHRSSGAPVAPCSNMKTENGVKSTIQTDPCDYKGHTLMDTRTDLIAVPHAGLRDPNPEKPGEGDQSSCS